MTNTEAEAKAKGAFHKGVIDELQSLTGVKNIRVRVEFANRMLALAEEYALHSRKEAEQQRWIPFSKENRPELGKGVLIRLDNGFITVGYTKDTAHGRFWQVFGPLDIFQVDKDNEVTHWQPLPGSPIK